MSAASDCRYLTGGGAGIRSLPSSVPVRDVRFQSVYLGRSADGGRAEAWDVQFWYQFMNVKSRRIRGSVSDAIRWMDERGQQTRQGPGHIGWTLHTPIEVKI